MGSCFSKKVDKAATIVVEGSQEPHHKEVSEKRDSKSYVDPLEITLETQPVQNDNVSDISMDSSNQSTSTVENVVEDVVKEEDVVEDEIAVVEEDNEVPPSLSTSSSIVIPVDIPKTANIIESQMDETLLHAFCEDVIHVIHTCVTETGRPKYEDIRNVNDVQDVKKIVLSLGKQKGSWEKVEIKDVVYVIRMITYEHLAYQKNNTSDSIEVTAKMIYKKKLEDGLIVE